MGIAERMIEIHDKSWGKLSCKLLTGEMTSAGYPCSLTSIRRWCKAPEASRRQYIKPRPCAITTLNCPGLLIITTNAEESLWCTAMALTETKNSFLSTGTVVFADYPKLVRESAGCAGRFVTMPADVKVHHKSHMPKVMFLACTAQPRAE